MGMARPGQVGVASYDTDENCNVALALIPYSIGPTPADLKGNGTGESGPIFTSNIQGILSADMS